MAKRMSQSSKSCLFEMLLERARQERALINVRRSHLCACSLSSAQLSYCACVAGLAACILVVVVVVVVCAAVVSAVVAVSLFLFNFKMAAKIKYLFFSFRLFFDGVLRKTSLLCWQSGCPR